jgi:hypothetical protein
MNTAEQNSHAYPRCRTAGVTVPDVDSGWGVVIGAVVTFAGSVIGPYFLERSKAHNGAELSRRNEIAALVPKIADSIAENQTEPPAGEIALLARLEFLLAKGEDDVSRIAFSAATIRTGPRAGAMVETLGRWFRGSLDVDEVWDEYTRIVREGEYPITT